MAYVLSEADVQFLRQLKRAYANGELRAAQSRRQQYLDPHTIEFGKANATIDGCTSAGSNPKSGTVSIYTFDGTTTYGTTDTGMDVTAINFSTVAITTEAWLQLRRHRTGSYVITGAFDQVRKPLIRFTAATAPSTGSATFTGTIKTQYGPGVPASTASSVTINNLQISSSNYLFAGSTGAAGYAIWDSGTTYTGIQLECT